MVRSSVKEKSIIQTCNFTYFNQNSAIQIDLKYPDNTNQY